MHAPRKGILGLPQSSSCRNGDRSNSGYKSGISWHISNSARVTAARVDPLRITRSGKDAKVQQYGGVIHVRQYM